FEKDNPKIKVALWRSGTVEIMKQISKEFEDGPPRADVLCLDDFSSAEELKEKGFLQKYVSPQAAKIQPLFKDSEGYYTGSRLTGMVIAYNTELVGKKPAGYNDLLNREWKGKIAIADPVYSGNSRFTIYSLLLNKNFAWGYFVKLYRNKCRLIETHTILTGKIAAGEIHMGITIDFSVRKLLNQFPGLPIDYVYPDGGVVTLTSPIVITEGCRNKTSAKKFVDWVLSEKGQRFMSEKIGITPLREDVPLPAGMPPLDDLKIVPANPMQIFKNMRACEKIFNDIFSGKPLSEINTGMSIPARRKGKE
ncbi:MAG: extracellular solute-binding protein, partial [Elusimicrobia bacterium]|nr:extracellular solute-binding protein [Elusimicrobiota bacterium]